MPWHHSLYALECRADYFGKCIKLHSVLTSATSSVSRFEMRTRLWVGRRSPTALFEN